MENGTFTNELNGNKERKAKGDTLWTEEEEEDSAVATADELAEYIFYQTKMKMNQKCEME